MSSTISLRSGDLVWSKFPFDDEPDDPGATRHLARVIAVFAPRQAAIATEAPVSTQSLVVGVYTSSKVGKLGSNVPVGVIAVGAAQAYQLGKQVPFFIDVRRRAFIPHTPTFFPDMHLPSGGVVASAGKRLFDIVKKHYALVNERHRDLIVNVGPLRPR